MNPQWLFGDEDFELLKFPEQGPFELADEAGAPPAAEVQDGEDDDLIEVEATFSLPDATERESTLMGGQPTEPGHKAPLDGIEKLDGKGAALVVGQGKIKVVTASRPSHRSSPPGGCW